ncbi:unnamed protein product [Phytophthora fragariaefolia]|uniref:Unnamed protein product n=1 Tax=Phytophthora fragariaefolia TaxID=1490495 RepID=A0A9W6Y3L0_9STRA|nr:unnamed protein product [Phytophthora fragariaefolia]
MDRSTCHHPLGIAQLYDCFGLRLAFVTESSTRPCTRDTHRIIPQVIFFRTPSKQGEIDRRMRTTSTPSVGNPHTPSEKINLAVVSPCKSRKPASQSQRAVLNPSHPQSHLQSSSLQYPLASPLNSFSQFLTFTSKHQPHTSNSTGYIFSSPLQTDPVTKQLQHPCESKGSPPRSLLNLPPAAQSPPFRQAPSPPPTMLHLTRSRVLQRLVLARGVASTRPLLLALQTAKPPLTSLNNAAAAAQLGLDGTLEEVASSHFSEASAFPEFSPMEDALLSQAVPRIIRAAPVMDAHALAQVQLTAEMQQHFCESSDFPEYTPAEEEAMMLKEM